MVPNYGYGYLRPMGNNWFRFRQFMVHQENAAMKVTTDACLFGALQPLFPAEGKGKRILDIGAGTGLLSLMMAQLNPGATISAVEIDAGAANDAARNFAGSPFSDRLTLQQANILLFEPEQPFDYILCNPPFYESQLISPDKTRNIAHHSADLKMGDLLSVSERLLNENGGLSLLIPYYRENELLKLAGETGFFCQKLIRVRQTPKHNYFRSIILLEKQPTEMETMELMIRNEKNEYSPEFQALLKPFYLNL